MKWGNTLHPQDAFNRFRKHYASSTYPWFRLHRIQIHPDVLDAVLLEVKKRGDETTELRWRSELENRRQQGW